MSTITTMLPWSDYHRQPAFKGEIPLQEPARCPFCDGNDGEELFHVEDFQFFDDRAGDNRACQRVVHCGFCGFLYTDPWFTAEGRSRLFAKAGRSYGHCDPEERVNWVRQVVPERRRILDLGCGDGSFLRAFPRDFHCAGADVDPVLIDLARRQNPDHQFFLQDFSREAIPFQAEVITLFHLLEHLDDPIAGLCRLRQGCDGDTRLIVEVPVLDRAREVQGRDLCGFFSLPHRSHFSIGSLDRMLRRAGWQVLLRHNLEGNGHRVLARPGPEEPAWPGEDDRQRDRATLRAYLEILEQSRHTMRKRVARINGDRILIWGAGHHTEYLDRFTDLFQTGRQFLIVDNDPLKHGTTMHGIAVRHPDHLPGHFWREIDFPVVISSFAWRLAIWNDLVRRGVSSEYLVDLYEERPV